MRIYIHYYWDIEVRLYRTDASEIKEVLTQPTASESSLPKTMYAAPWWRWVDLVSGISNERQLILRVRICIIIALTAMSFVEKLETTSVSEPPTQTLFCDKKRLAHPRANGFVCLIPLVSVTHPSLGSIWIKASNYRFLCLNGDYLWKRLWKTERSSLRIIIYVPTHSSLCFK